MGQYYYIVNLDKKEFIHPHTLGNGLKWGEWASGGGTMFALALLISDNESRWPELKEYAGRWAGDRIVAAGDYGPLGQEVTESDYINISLPIREAMLAAIPWAKETIGKRWDAPR